MSPDTYAAIFIFAASAAMTVTVLVSLHRDDRKPRRPLLSDETQASREQLRRRAVEAARLRGGRR